MASCGVTSPVFKRLDHDRYQPTDYARGPWDPRAMHGGAPSALLAGVLETALAHPDDAVPMHPSRLAAKASRAALPAECIWIARADLAGAALPAPIRRLLAR